MAFENWPQFRFVQFNQPQTYTLSFRQVIYSFVLVPFSKGRDFSYSCSFGPNHFKPEPSQIQTSKRSDFEWVANSNVWYSSPNLKFNLTKEQWLQCRWKSLGSVPKVLTRRKNLQKVFGSSWWTETGCCLGLEMPAWKNPNRPILNSKNLFKRTNYLAFQCRQAKLPDDFDYWTITGALNLSRKKAHP